MALLRWPRTACVALGRATDSGESVGLQTSGDGRVRRRRIQACSYARSSVHSDRISRRVTRDGPLCVHGARSVTDRATRIERAATPYPRVGDIWRSRDPRDYGIRVTVLAVDEERGRVQIKRVNRVWVRLSRWAKAYEFERSGL